MYWWDFENPVASLTSNYGEDLESEETCQVHAWPLSLSNIKYYRGWMNNEDMLKECIKYTTNHDQCVINDLARPLTDGHGYSVK